LIIIISDLHLTDGTFDYTDTLNPGNDINHDVSSEAFELFWNHIYRIVTANEADFIKKITLVLLGDILELRSTTKWMDDKCNPSGSRPWKEHDNNQIEVCKKIIDGIDDNNGESLKYICPKKFNQVKDNSNGLRQLIDHDIEIKVVYVVGNHDRMIVVHDSLKEHVQDRFGWEFSIATDGIGEGHVFMVDDIGLLAYHGHGGEKPDIIDFYKNYEEPPIGALLSDVFGRLMYHTQNSEFKKLITFSMELDNVRPSSDKFAWILSNLPDKDEDPDELAALRKILKQCLKELLDESDLIFDFLYSRLREEMDKIPWWGDILISLACLFQSKKKCLKKTLMKLLRNMIENLRKDEEEYPLIKIFEDIQNNIFVKLIPKLLKKKKNRFSGPDSRYYKNAHHEMKNKVDTPYKYIVYGHSHRYKLIPLITFRGLKDTFYFNSGTWRKTVEKNIFPEKSGDFQKWNRMTYITFFSESENSDHIFDIWHGNLQTDKDF